jgi:hypothetical protein
MRQHVHDVKKHENETHDGFRGECDSAHATMQCDCRTTYFFDHLSDPECSLAVNYVPLHWLNSRANQSRLVATKTPITRPDCIVVFELSVNISSKT